MRTEIAFDRIVCALCVDVLQCNVLRTGPLPVHTPMMLLVNSVYVSVSVFLSLPFSFSPFSKHLCVLIDSIRLNMNANTKLEHTIVCIRNKHFRSASFESVFGGKLCSASQRAADAATNNSHPASGGTSIIHTANNFHIENMRFTVAFSVNQMNYFLQNSFASLDPFPVDMANALQRLQCCQPGKWSCIPFVVGGDSCV